MVKKLSAISFCCLTDMVFEKDFKAPLCLLSPHPGTGLICKKDAHTIIHMHTEKKPAMSSEDSSEINFCLFPVRFIIHLHQSLLTYSLPPVLYPLSPPVLTLSREKLISLFSLCEWTRKITSL